MTDLNVIRSRLTVDIDQLDSVLAARLGPFCDMTSNQALIAGVVTSWPEHPVLREVVDIINKDHRQGQDGAEYAMDLLAVLLAKSVLPHLTGRVHAQLSPRYAHSTSQSLSHALRLVDLFGSHGITTDRLCLKIPANGAGIACAAILEARGIRTLATTLFSTEQALAAAQAGCLYVAPYFNELSVHFERETWIEYSDIARQHPMSAVISDIVTLFKTIPGAPLVMPASIVSAEEALAISSLGVDHMTLSGPVLESLSNTDGEEATAWRHVRVYSAEIISDAIHPAKSNADFISGGGRMLDEVIAANESVSRRLDYALQAFGRCEQKVVDLVLSRLNGV